jgi:hypothetical protein
VKTNSPTTLNSLSPRQRLSLSKYTLGDIGFGLKTENQYPCRLTPNDTRETSGDIGRHSNAFDPLTATCPDEAEALKGAPPWEGFWLEPPTLMQRIKQWTDYLVR